VTVKTDATRFVVPRDCVQLALAFRAGKRGTSRHGSVARFDHARVADAVVESSPLVIKHQNDVADQKRENIEVVGKITSNDSSDGKLAAIRE